MVAFPFGHLPGLGFGSSDLAVAAHRTAALGSVETAHDVTAGGLPVPSHT